MESKNIKAIKYHREKKKNTPLEYFWHKPKEGVPKWHFKAALELKCWGFEDEGSRPETVTEQQKPIALMVGAWLCPFSWAPVLERIDWLEERVEWTRA